MKSVKFLSLVLALILLSLSVVSCGFIDLDDLDILDKITNRDNDKISNTVVMQLGDVEVDEAMMNFFYNDYIMTFQNNYGIYAGLLGVDFSKSLKSQQFPKGGLASYFLGESYDGTWYDYFLDKVVDEVEIYVTLCNAANEEDVRLDADDMDIIDEKVEAIRASVKQSKSKLSDLYGKGVNQSDVRRCYELIVLANKYSEYKYELIEDELESEGESALEDFIERNKKDFYSAEYLSFDIVVSAKGLTDEEYAAKIAEAKEEAKNIAEAGNVEAFLNLVNEYEATQKSEIKTVDIEEEADDYRHTINYETSTGSVGEWIFKENASEGDGKVFSTEKTEVVEADEKTYKVTTVTAYLVTKASHLDNTLTNNIAFVISDKKDYINAFDTKFAASSEKTLDSFEKIAEEYYNSLHEGHDHSSSTTTEPVFVYDKVEQASADFFKTNYFNKDNKMDEWLEGDLKRGQLSSIIMVEVNKDTAYYAVIFFDSKDDEQWKVDAFNGVAGERYEEWYENDSGKNDIDYDQDALENIDEAAIG